MGRVVCERHGKSAIACVCPHLAEDAQAQRALRRHVGYPLQLGGEPLMTCRACVACARSLDLPLPPRPIDAQAWIPETWGCCARCYAEAAELHDSDEKRLLVAHLELARLARRFGHEGVGDTTGELAAAMKACAIACEAVIADGDDVTSLRRRHGELTGELRDELRARAAEAHREAEIARDRGADPRPWFARKNRYEAVAKVLAELARVTDRTAPSP